LLATYAFMADLHRVPMMLYGIGVGPLATRAGRDLSAWIARRAALVTCRDATSARWIAELAPEAAVEQLPDPVLGLRPAEDAELEALWREEGIEPRSERPRLALALRDVRFLGDHRPRLLDALRELSADFDMLFVPQCTGTDCDDREEGFALERELPGARCLHIRHRHLPSVLARTYESADATLALRLHGAVFSVMAGTPTTAIAYLPKVRAFMESVDLGRQVLELEDSGAKIAARVSSSLGGTTATSRQRLESAKAGTTAYLERIEALLGLGPGTEPQPALGGLAARDR
jgi:polysaccharide pyruvyl transferase WcaK-like protein